MAKSKSMWNSRWKCVPDISSCARYGMSTIVKSGFKDLDREKNETRQYEFNYPRYILHTPYKNEQHPSTE